MNRIHKMDYVIGLHTKYEWRLYDGKITNEQFDKLLKDAVTKYLNCDVATYLKASSKYVQKIEEEDPDFWSFYLYKLANEASEIMDLHKDVFVKNQKDKYEKELGLPSIDESKIKKLEKKANVIKKQKEKSTKKKKKSEKIKNL